MQVANAHLEGECSTQLPSNEENVCKTVPSFSQTWWQRCKKRMMILRPAEVWASLHSGHGREEWNGFTLGNLTVSLKILWPRNSTSKHVRDASNKYVHESRSVVSNSLRPHRLYSPWNSLGQNTGVGSLSLLQGIFQIQELNQCLLHRRWFLYQLSYQGSPHAHYSTVNNGENIRYNLNVQL